MLFPKTAGVDPRSLILCAKCPEVTHSADFSVQHAMGAHPEGAAVSTVPARLVCARCGDGQVTNAGENAVCKTMMHAAMCRRKEDVAARPGIWYTCEPCDISLRNEKELHVHLEQHVQGRLGAQSRCRLCDYSGLFLSCHRHVQDAHRGLYLLGCALCPAFGTNSWTQAEQHIYQLHDRTAAAPLQVCPACRLTLVGGPGLLKKHLQLHRDNKVKTIERAPRRSGLRYRTGGRRETESQTHGRKLTSPSTRSKTVTNNEPQSQPVPKPAPKREPEPELEPEREPEPELEPEREPEPEPKREPESEPEREPEPEPKREPESEPEREPESEPEPEPEPEPESEPEPELEPELERERAFEFESGSEPPFDLPEDDSPSEAPGSPPGREDDTKLDMAARVSVQRLEPAGVL